MDNANSSTLMTMLGALPQDDKIQWQDWVSTLVHAYNCTTTRVTGYSPYFLMFGREPRIPVDETFGKVKSKEGSLGVYTRQITFFWPAESPGYHQWQQESQ